MNLSSLAFWTPPSTIVAPRVLLFGSLLTFFASASSGMACTTIIARWRPNEIVIGVDSLKTETSQEGTTEERICKISKVAGLFLAVSGLTRETSTGFDVRGIGLNAAQDGKTVNTTTLLFIERVLPPLESAFEHARQVHPTHYQDKYESRQALNVLFFGIEEGKAIVSLIGFTPRAVGPARVSVSISTRQSCPSEGCQTEQWVLMGEVEAILPEFQKGSSSSSETLVPRIRELIEREIARVPDRVGHPINILRISQEGVEWLFRGPGSACFLD